MSVPKMNSLGRGLQVCTCMGTVVAMRQKPPAKTPMSTDERIATRVKAILGARGISITELADLTGQSRVTLSRHLNGTYSMRVDEAYRIAKALGVTIDELTSSRTMQIEVPA